ncbi:hypothetical protein AYO49_01645 [Verrucomicrobiaceae bacterium SCGC AG-212-N21]|nr:hypothetical protein AYO49_01645 [Verrucomicrobiaceae bacterium SCGC AG-212-N21]
MIQTAWPVRALFLGAALSAGSCVSLEQYAPLVESVPMQARVGSANQLEHGRDIYITKCAKCHSVEPVKKYPLHQWEQEILPEMSEETKLSPAEVAAVRAYVLSVLRMQN